MKRSILVTALALVGLAGFSFSVEGAPRRDERRDDRRDYRREYDERYSDFRQLRAELNALNIQFARVESHFRYYGGGYGIGRQTRWEYSRLVRDRNRLEYELQRRPLNRPLIHSQIDRIRDQLREIEVRLRVRPHRYHRY